MVEAHGRVVELTAKEYALLEYLLLNRGRVVTRQEIAEHVWDERFDPFSNVIEVYVGRLRQKIDALPARKAFLISDDPAWRGVLRRAHRAGAGLTRLSIRWKLTLWYGAALCGILALFSVASFVQYRRAALRAFDADLLSNLSTLHTALIEELGEQVQTRTGRNFRRIGPSLFPWTGSSERPGKPPRTSD